MAHGRTWYKSHRSESKKIMVHTIPSEILSLLVSDKLIEKNLKSVIWFGSTRNNRDVHKRSDYDIQIVLREPSSELTLRINEILVNYPNIDLSIMYMHDIYDNSGRVIFHDGTKGLFFMYVLAAGEILHGENIYASIIGSLNLEDIKPSLEITIREYLSRLRVMAAQSPNDTLLFKKYSLKLFKDVLLYLGLAPLKDMAKITNAEVRKGIIGFHSFSDVSNKALKAITDYEHNFSQEELASLLDDFEKIVQWICNV